MHSEWDRDTTVSLSFFVRARDLRNRNRKGIIRLALALIMYGLEITSIQLTVIEPFNGFLSALPGIGFATAVGAALYLLPGLALLEIFWCDVRLDLPMRLALALGIGVALPPLLLELAHLIRLPWQSSTVAVYLSLALLTLAGSFYRSWRQHPALKLSLSWHAMLLLWLVVLATIMRLFVVRDLPVGLWGDSYQHTMMAQLIVDHQGLFSSWEPYAPLATFTYHFGFHANVAFFHWLTGIPVTQSVIDVGQILNAATVPMAYLLTVRLTKNRAAGVWAALLTGFLNTQPAYYVNWGRYTQLAGQVILPAVIVLWMDALERERWDWRLIGLSVLMSAGLALTHYIVTIFAALFLIVYVLALWIRTPSRQTVVRLLSRGGVIALIALTLAAPWLANALSGYLTRNTLGFVNGAVSADRIAGYATLPSLVPVFLKWQILLAAAVGVVMALVKREWRMMLIAVWAPVLLLAVVPYVVGLPGSGIVDYFTVYIALYLPILPLAGYAIGTAQATVERWHPRLIPVVMAGAVIALSVWGLTLRVGQLELQYQLFTPADAKAMEWIQSHTPRDARFLVNSFPAYAGTLIAGTDGGWWIPLLTGRQTNLPPLTYGSERGSAPDFAQRTNAWWARLRGRPLTDLAPVRVDVTMATALQTLRESGIGYVYGGARAAPGPDGADWIDTAALKARPDLFRLMYDQDGVLIFALEKQP